MDQRRHTQRAAGASFEQFDRLAASYDAWFGTPLGSFVDRKEQQTLDGLLRASPAESMLDLGAGTGRRAGALAAKGVRCVALEPSAEMLSVALRAARAGGPAWVRGVGERLPFVDGAFDAVLCVNVLEFVDDYERVIAEAVRVTRAGGRLVFGVLSAAGPWAEARRHRAGVWSAACLFERGKLERLLSTYGHVETRLAVYVAPQLRRAPRAVLAIVDALFRRWKPQNGAFIAARLDVR